MERLTEKDSGVVRFNDTNLIVAMIDKLKRYEDAEEQRLLIKLPCKVGDTVWFLMAEHYDRCVADEEGEICLCTVENITIAEPYWSFNNGEHEFKPSDFGKTVFLTREAAEQSLRGGERS